MATGWCLLLWYFLPGSNIIPESKRNNNNNNDSNNNNKKKKINICTGNLIN